jgi:hypothetical protein
MLLASMLLLVLNFNIRRVSFVFLEIALTLV